MSDSTSGLPISHRRLLAEGVAIVASILIAFAIDAAWDNRQDQQELRTVLSSLQTEFQALRDTLSYWESRQERRAEELSTLLSTLDSPFDVNELSLLDSTFYAVVNMSDWDPRGGVIEGVIASGKLDLLTDGQLQRELGSWPGVVDDATDNQHLMQDYVLNQLIPALARGGYSVSRAFGRTRSADDPWPASFPADRQALASYRRLAEDQEVVDLIAAKYAFIRSSARDIGRAEEAASRVLVLIEGALEN